jgi:hypothetical protein
MFLLTSKTKSRVLTLHARTPGPLSSLQKMMVVRLKKRLGKSQQGKSYLCVLGVTDTEITYQVSAVRQECTSVYFYEQGTKTDFNN